MRLPILQGASVINCWSDWHKYLEQWGEAEFGFTPFELAHNGEQVLSEKGVEDEPPTVDCGSTLKTVIRVTLECTHIFRLPLEAPEP